MLSGVVSGIGTEEDPFIIAGWLIEAYGINEGITIIGTTLHFRIESNNIKGAMVAGIHLMNVRNGAVSGNLLEENFNGILCDLNSSNFTVESNTILNTGGTGIQLLAVNNGSLDNNVVDNAPTGLDLRDSPYLRVNGSVLVNISVLGQRLSGNFAFEQYNHSSKGPRTDGDSNVSDCRKFIFLEGATGTVIATGGFRLDNCMDGRISGYNVSNCNGPGITINSCENITIDNVTCNNNTGSGMVVSNITGSNRNYGIMIADSNCSGNSKNGIEINNCNKTSDILRVKAGPNGAAGVNSTSSRNWCFRLVVCDNNSGDGMNLTGCDSIKVQNSTTNMNKGDGIAATNTSNSDISWHAANLNFRNGIVLKDFENESFGISVTDSILIGNGRVGLISSTNVARFDNHVIKGNGGSGLIAENCSYLRIDNIHFESNGGDGLRLVDVKSSLIVNMSRSSNESQGCGLRLLRCGDVHCYGGMTASGNSECGALVEDSEDVEFCPGTWSFSGFKLYGNEGDGLRVKGSKNVTLENGTSTFNKGSGCNISNSVNVTVAGFNFSDNDMDGFELYCDNELYIGPGNASNNKGSGINVTKASNLHLSNVTCKNNSKDGVKINSTVSSEKNETDMRYVACSLNGGNGITLFNLSAGTTFVYVQCDSNSGSGARVTFDVTLKSLHIFNSTFNYNLGNGLHFDQCGHVDVRDSDANGNSNGIVIENTSSSSIRGGNTNWNFGSGLVIKNSSNATVLKLKVNGSSMNGIDVSTSSNSCFEEVLASGNSGYGIRLMSSDRVIVYNCTFSGNNFGGIQAFDDGLENLWNSSSGYGNWWSDWTAPDDLAPWGIVDIPYDISGSAGAKDYCPRVAISELGPLSLMITSPTSSSTYSTNWGWMKLIGTAEDDVAVTSVVWTNDRGGSGTMYMTPQYGGPSVSWQSRGNVQLFAGENIITVVAHDGEGHAVMDILTVTYEKILPTITITAPTSSSHHSTNSATIDLAGSASDASGISTVVWKNVATGVSGTATGKESWSIAGIALNLGMNLIYVNATDSAGNKNYDAIWVTCDLNSLAVAITDPTSDPTMTTNWHYVKIKGVASDDNKVTLVTWSNALTGDSGTMYMTPQWGGPSVTWQTRGQVHLLPGNNEITVTAYDNAGNTKTDKIVVTYTGLE